MNCSIWRVILLIVTLIISLGLFSMNRYYFNFYQFLVDEIDVVEINYSLKNGEM